MVDEPFAFCDEVIDAVEKWIFYAKAGVRPLTQSPINLSPSW